MFEIKGVAALGQFITAVIAAIVFPLAGFALLGTAFSIEESNRQISAYYMPVCFFVLGIGAVVIAIWRFVVFRRYSNNAKVRDENPVLESYSEEEEAKEEALAENIDEQTRQHNIEARE